MTDERPTPETDAIQLTDRGASGLLVDYVSLARRLERERDALREALRELVRIDDSGMGVIGWDAAMDRARALLEETP